MAKGSEKRRAKRKGGTNERRKGDKKGEGGVKERSGKVGGVGMAAPRPRSGQVRVWRG